MEMEILVPDEVPVMTLPRVVFFPQTLMPLHIFEPRYRQMLSHVLARDRLMAVAGLDSRQQNDTGSFEPPHRVATIGIIRACQKSPDGTSNLLLQGLCRAQILEIAQEDPYRVIRIKALQSNSTASPETNAALRHEIHRLITLKQQCVGESTKELNDFMRTVEDPDSFADLAAFSFCENPAIKQQLLETLDVSARLEILSRHLQGEIAKIRLRQDLQGDLPDDNIALN